jgi:HlyD family secretion protein
VLGNISSGAADDLKRATEIAFKMVAHYGMSEKVGPVFHEHKVEHPFLGQRLATEGGTSDVTVRQMEDEVRNLLVHAQREAERQRALQERGLISAQERETADRRYAEASLQQRMAREKLQLLEQGSIRGAGGVESVVRAPIDGFLLQKNIEVGDPVVPLSSYQEGTVLMTMANMERLLFRGTVDEIDVGRLAEGMPVEVKIGALPGAKLSGRVHRISLKAQKQESATTFPVEIALDAADGVTLRAGLSANADVIIQKREGVLVVPERVVTFEDGGAWVQVARADGTSEKRVVRTGLSDAIQVEVLEGLKEGERVLEKAEKSVQ